MSNVSLGLSSNAAGASQVVYTLKFTSSQAGALAAAAGQIFLTAPAGTMFPSMGGRFFVEDLSVKGPAPTAAEAQVSPAGNEATVTVPIAVGGGDRVSLTVDGVTNTGTEGPQRVTVSTSADTAPALAPTFNLAAPGAVSAPSLSISSDAGGADQVNYQMSFTTTRDGALVESLGEIVLSAPPGTVFPSVGSDYFVTDLTSHAPAASVSPAVAGGGAVVAVTVPGDIQAGDRVSLLVQGVVNSAEIAQVRTSLWTTSDTVPAVPTPAASEKPAPVAALSLGLSSDNGGAGGVSYQLRFTTSAHGSLVANKGDVTISAPPGTVFPVAPGDYSVSDLTSKSPVSTPGVSLSGTGNVATLQMSAAIAAGDRVSIDISGVTNPARGKAVVDLWTSSDLVPAVTSHDIVAASPVRDLSLTMSSQAASVSMVSYQVTFVPGPRGSLVASHGDITLLAPAGTSLPNAPPDYRVTDVTTGSGPQVPAGVTWGGDPNAGVRGANEATLTVPMAVAPGDKVVIVANGVTNPPVGRAALQLWTSSEKEPVPSRTFSFTPAKALSAAHLSTTPAVAPATGPTWVLGFRTGPEGGLGAGSGLITIEGPPGTVFPSVAGDYEVQTGATAPVNPDQVTVLGGGGLADLVPGSPVGPGAEVTVRVSDVTGTNGGRPAGQVRLSTSSQPAPEILSGSTHPVKTAAVTSPSVSVSAPEAGASMATYSLRFTTSPSGALAGPSAANPGTITVELPPGAAFACAAGECPFYDFAVNGQRSPSVALSPDSSAATLEVPAPIAPSQVVTASFFNVANTTVPGLHDLRVWTSSDPSAVSVPFDLAATSSVSAPSLALSTSAAGASFADYLLHFTTGPDGALPGSASGNAAPGTITLVAPPETVFPDCFTIECGYEPSYWLTYGSGKAAPCSTSAPGGGCGIATGVLTDDGGSVTISVSKPIPASTPVTLSIADVVNASLTGRGRALVSTSSQPRPVPV
ncbi:MAG TPA: hypothetical protein VL984_07110, partial [Acidimicrobiales bacterium]|nr:hypothetical protein [Acidimicrobiales bacterium]